MQHYPTCTQVVRSDIFCSYLYFLYAYAVFPFALVSHSGLLSQMLWLEFHVNQRGLKRHHWSTSSWLTAPLQPIQSKKGGDVTSTRLISCRCSAFILQVEMNYCQLGYIFPYRTALYVAICQAKWAVLASKLMRCAWESHAINCTALLATHCHYVHLYLFT